jgi:hypothetical protein
MRRNFLKGVEGDLPNIILAAYDYNLKKIYNKFTKAYQKKLSWLFLLLFPQLLGSRTYPILLRR